MQWAIYTRYPPSIFASLITLNLPFSSVIRILEIAFQACFFQTLSISGTTDCLMAIVVPFLSSGLFTLSDTENDLCCETDEIAQSSQWHR